jgi:hypothetical protein
LADAECSSPEGGGRRRLRRRRSKFRRSCLAAELDVSRRSNSVSPRKSLSSWKRSALFPLTRFLLLETAGRRLPISTCQSRPLRISASQRWLAPRAAEVFSAKPQLAPAGFLVFFASAGKNAWQAGLNKFRCRAMQTVMRSTSGISELQSRIASLLQSCCCSGV